MSYKQFFKYRSVWMGIAIFLLFFFHANYTIKSETINILKTFSYFSVDMFVFASGLGCATSYRKNRDTYQFIKRRLIRIFKVYIPFMLVWIPTYFLYDKMPVRSIIGNLLGIEAFTLSDYALNWYISFIIVLYFFTPFLVEAVERAGKWYQFLFIELILILISVPFFGNKTIIIMTTRLPIFVIGIYFAVHYDVEEKISRTVKLVLLAGIPFGYLMLRFFVLHYFDYLWDWGFYWYPCIFFTPGLCFLISCFCDFVNRRNLKICGLLVRFLSFSRKLSLELYLTHILVLSLYYRSGVPIKSHVMTIMLIVSYLAAILLNRVSKLRIKPKADANP